MPPTAMAPCVHFPDPVSFGWLLGLSLSLPLVMASRLMGVEASLANGGVQAGLVENPGEDNHDMRVSLLGLPSLSVVEVPLFLLYSL